MNNEIEIKELDQLKIAKLFRSANRKGDEGVLLIILDAQRSKETEQIIYKIFTKDIRIIQQKTEYHRVWMNIENRVEFSEKNGNICGKVMYDTINDDKRKTLEANDFCVKLFKRLSYKEI